MNYYTKLLSGLFGGLLLLISASGVVQAQGPRYGDRGQYFISGTIRWKTDMGIIPAGPGNRQAAASPCGQFFVAATDPGTGAGIAYSSGMTQQPDDGDYHVCSYSFKAPPNRSLYLIAGMGGVLLLPKMDESSFYWTDAWIGGSRSKPPAGAFRTFSGYKYITLTAGRHRGSASFEMIYGRRDNLQ